MGGIRRAISNFGDVQIALNDIYTQLNALTTQPQDLQQRILTGIPDPKNPLDAVNFETLQSYVASQIAIIAKTIPPKPTLPPPNATAVTFGKNLVPKIDATYSFGSATLTWLKGWFKNLNITSLTASKPVKTDANKNLVSAQIDLTTDITGILPTANGGTGDATLTAHAVLLGNGTGGITFAPIGTSGRVLTDNGAGADPTFQVVGGVISFNTRTGAVTLTSGDLTALNAVLGGSSPTLNALTTATLTILGLTTLAGVKFGSGNTTGAGTALLGTNSPATVLTAPYTWLTITSSDGTTCYIPVWK